MTRKKGHPQATTPPNSYRVYSVPADLKPLGDYAKLIIGTQKHEHDKLRDHWRRNRK